MRGKISMLLCVAGLIALPIAAGDQPKKKDATRFDLPAKKSWYALLEMPANHKASLQVKSEGGDIDLFVIDVLGKVIASDTSVGKDCKVQFTAKEPQVVLVKVANVGFMDNRCAFEHNAKSGHPQVQPLAKVPAGGKRAFFVYHHLGNVATLRGGFKGGVSMSVYDVDNVKIAADPHGRFVAWENKPPKIARVVLSNTGKEEATARLLDSALTLPTVAEPAFDLAHEGKRTFEIQFKAENVAAIWVASEKNTDVDIIVYDAKGKEIVSDITIGKDCFVGWLVQAAATYRVVVVNQGKGANRCVLKHNGEATKK